MAVRTDALSRECVALIAGMEWDEDAGAAVAEDIRFDGVAEFKATETSEGSNTFEATVEWPETLTDELIVQERREWCRDYENHLGNLFPGCTVLWF